MLRAALISAAVVWWLFAGFSFASDRKQGDVPDALIGKWELASVDGHATSSDGDFIAVSKQGLSLPFECNWMLLDIEIDKGVLRIAERGPVTAMKCGDNEAYPAQRSIVSKALRDSRYELEKDKLRFFPNHSGDSNVLEFRRLN